MAKKFPEKNVVQRRGIYYWYPRRYIFDGSPFKVTRLPDEFYNAMEKAKLLNKELVAWHEDSILPAAGVGSINWLIKEYKSSEGFLNLADKSQKMNAVYLQKIGEKLGDIAAVKIEPKHAYKFYENLKREYPDKQRTVVAIIAATRAMFSFGRLIGANKENPFTNLRISKNPPRTQVWTAEEISIFIKTAAELNRRSIGLAVRMGADLGQRQGDILSLRWNQFDGSAFKIKQSKTGAFVEVPCSKELRIMLDRTDRTSTHIIVSEATKQPYKSDYFKHQFREIADDSGIREELQFLDLRRTCVVRLAEASCSVPEIAAITGHSIDTCQEIMEVYLPRNSEMARNAMKKLERVNKSKSRNT